MSASDVKKNFALAESYASFLLSNDRFRNSAPKKAYVVMGSASDKELTRKNLELAHEGMKRNRKPYFQAIKYSRTWRIVKVSKPKAKK